MNRQSEYTRRIKEETRRLGFQHCGIARAEFLEEEASRFEHWLRGNMHGEMKYMEHHFDKRLDPRMLVEGAKSVITLLLNYYPEKKQNDDAPVISKYAYGNDYHYVIKYKLKQLLHFIRDRIGQVNGRAFVDSAPVMDKAWAKRSGLGWIGKNSNLINRRHGSFLFVAELIVDLELEYDSPIGDYCGNCRRCMDACPTNAIVEPYVVDGSRCISYFTIELKESIPEEMSGKFGNWAFGCDICQDVCPWNRFAEPHHEPELEPYEELMNMKWSDWEEITEEIFDKTFALSAVRRTGFSGMKRNIRFIRGLQPSLSPPLPAPAQTLPV